MDNTGKPLFIVPVTIVCLFSGRGLEFKVRIYTTQEGMAIRLQITKTVKYVYNMLLISNTPNQ